MSAGSVANELPADATALVVTASNRAAAGVYDDTSGEFLESALAESGFAVRRVVLPDDEAQLADALRDGVAEGRDVILTTGGTGLTPTDCTPEATRAVIERDVPGVAEAIRTFSVETVPTAVLSRGLAGVAGRTLIVNLPGSRGGVKDGIAVLRPILGHIVSQLRGGDHPRA